ncbi:hypothetical protein [Bacillus thuringiensis]|uniref:hypothetical protein n=1 Tax=Bacillus thuringiensis TaxID=1428 RepID=UPI000BF3735E|nr:hypothetical protein [Bacillus thuringiensis]MEC0031092.1 hypothetical protein [Bacillus cereus]PFC28506.1 hypothetical protein CN299_19745 [Bacillus thuringiensis]
MNVTVGRVKRKPDVGDVIEYDNTSRKKSRKHGFYMLCESNQDGYFVMSLTGQKGRMTFYGSIESLLANQSNIINIYPKEDWELGLNKIA